MNIRKISWVALVAAMLAVLPARAETPPATRNIDVRTAEYVAYAVAAKAGDIIKWRTIAGRHNVVAYSGPQAFDSGDTNNSDPDAEGKCATYPCGGDPTGMTPYQSFAIQFVGGTVKYRCTLSFVDNSDPAKPGQVRPYSTIDQNGQCHGMCGTLTDAPPATLPGVPSILAPADAANVTTNRVSIGGTAPAGASSVKLREHLIGGGTKDLSPNAVIPVVNGTWSLDVTFANGSHTIDATSVHADGFRSDASPLRTFNVSGPDFAPPTVRIDKPAVTAAGLVLVVGKMNVDGRAFDDVAVSKVTVLIKDEARGEEHKPPVVFTPGLTDTQYHAEANLAPGRYIITVTATDSSGKSGAATREAIQVV